MVNIDKLKMQSVFKQLGIFKNSNGQKADLLAIKKLNWGKLGTNPGSSKLEGLNLGPKLGNMK